MKIGKEKEREPFDLGVELNGFRLRWWFCVGVVIISRVAVDCCVGTKTTVRMAEMKRGVCV